MKNNVKHIFSNSQKRIAIFALVGGLLISIGVFLPWLSLFAGLHPYPGILGLNGKILLGGGIISILAGIVLYYRKHQFIQRGIKTMAVIIAVFTTWILIGLWQTFQQLSADPLMVPQIGPGLFVVALGTIFLTGTLFSRFRPLHIKRK